MPSPSAATGDRLLHCSPARTVIERVDPTRGETVVEKVFVTGSLADAERECGMGQRAAGVGVVRYLAYGTDPHTNRPFVTTAKESGEDLGHMVAGRGALPAAEALALLAPVAATLARLHAMGLVHGDVKPRNLLRTATTTLLLDFEHAAAIGDRTGRGCGTAGFAAPETTHAAAAPSFDAFAWGRTLRWLLTGGIEAKVPQDPRVQTLLAACCAVDPSRRPDLVAIATTAAELAATLAEQQGEHCWHDAATATFGSPPAAADAGASAAAWRRRRALLTRLPDLFEVPPAIPDEPGPLRAELLRTTSVLRRFPRHAGLLRRRGELQRGLARLLHEAARHTGALGKAEAFLPAAAWLVDAEIATRHALALPGGVPLLDFDAAANVSLLHRDPLSHLQRLGMQLAAARNELHEQTGAVDRAVQTLDLPGAEQAIDAMAAHHGGASPSVARLRDQLHRLGFYLDRIGRAAPHVDRLAESIESGQIAPLLRFLAVAMRGLQRPGNAGDARGTVGLRSLQLTLANLAEEFPRVDDVRPAAAALTSALVHVTDHAFALLAEARQRLQTIPVPVRPLQLTLGRLDSFRIMEAFVDRPDRPRSQLLDGIESLRLSLEQARASRDRLTESAESAIARGHWTTGLFEMERAVAGLGPADDQEQEEASRLQARLADAKRRKQEVETTVRRNIELATQHGALQDDPGSTFEARLQVLEERRDCLLFLAMHVPSERGALYQRDLREVETQIALERAGLAEHQLDGTVDPQARLQLVRSTLDQLTASAAPNERGQEAPGRLLRLVEHWRTLADQCQRAVDQRHAEQALRARHRRRVLVALLVAVLATTAAIGFAVRPWLQGTPAMAGGR
jgi:hypothetical protein